MPALHEFVDTVNDVKRLRELLAKGEDPNSEDGKGRTPLHIAVLKSERNPQETREILAVAQVLIKFGAKVDAKDNNGCTPLLLAVMCRNYKMILILLMEKADINIKDKNGQAALHYAVTLCKFQRMNVNFCYRPEIRVVKLLLRYKPIIDIKNHADESPLMLAVRNNNLYIVRELLRNKASVLCQNIYGDCALHYAIALEELNLDIVSELARYGCPFFKKNDSDVTPREAYFNKLPNQPRSEVEKAKHMIKLFLLYGNDLDDSEEDCIRKISQENEDCNLLLFLDLCTREIAEMRADKVSSRYSVINIAHRGAFVQCFANCKKVPDDDFKILLEKLIRRQYPTFCDMIVMGILRPFMRENFAKKCCNEKTGITFLELDLLSLVSSYLSRIDMLNMMIACSGE